MPNSKTSSIRPSDITDERVYLKRRQLLKTLGLGGLAAMTSALADHGKLLSQRIETAASRPSQLRDELTQLDDITGYTNFYEFGTGKDDASLNARNFTTDPWQVRVDGHAEKTGKFDLEDLIRPHQLEERIYRMRCVEAWSMVIPWLGIPLGSVLKQFKPTSSARYVAFQTLHDPQQMPGQHRSVLRWPYTEGLRIDEAMHPLTLLALGIYGNRLEPQNGAPLRLVVPWKYGFKGVKSIVRISFVEKRPPTSWNLSAPQEYGFYANVNPSVDHPRWSQASERKIGAGFAFYNPRQETLMFNGYGEEVAHLYANLNLKRNF